MNYTTKNVGYTILDIFSKNILSASKCRKYLSLHSLKIFDQSKAVPLWPYLYLFKIKQDNQLQKRVISLTEKDFDLTTATFIYNNQVSLFEELKTFIEQHWKLLLIVIGLLIIVAYILVAERKKKTMPAAVNTILYNNFYASLSAVDKDLIKVLYEHYLNGEALTTKVINKLIGVQQKDVLTQNKSRSDHFIKINQKFNQSTQQKGALILKKRDEQDKRQFTYALNLTFIDEIARLLKA